ncbi:hypothetical protein GCM10027036_39910 [Flavihumibacter cheonanensis]|uniref:hypothetical protein n=1 Tax=Flavihumibacter cheonanensis TaxID=1442385 RepID=UPI001EF8847F|nr:hypothetical protein [Flavihumibacter cheonanensis]MCG7754704.1 hypothetical protein [Flavihumibacter cheonanensis]
MEPNHYGELEIQSRLSFAPLVDAWAKTAAEGRPGTRKLYQTLLDRIKRHPELLEPIEDISILKEHEEWVDMLMATLFPVSYSDQEDLYGVGLPFGREMIYCSKRFRELFLDASGQLNRIPEAVATQHLQEEKCASAYKLILSQLYGQNIDGNVTSIVKLPNPETGLDIYYELDLDTTFIKVHAQGELPDVSGLPQCCNVTDVLQQDELRKLFPLEKFRFEGITVVRIKDVTHREVINSIKNILLEQHGFGENQVFHQIERQVQALMGIPDLKMGVTPFFRVNEHQIVAEQFTHHSFLLKTDNSQKGTDHLCKIFQELFKETDQPLLISSITDEWLERYPMLINLTSIGYYSAAFFPLKSVGKLIGILSVVHKEAHAIKHQHLNEAVEAIPLFVLAMEQAAETLDNEVDKVIKQHFTAVQSSVEWKFTEAALQFIATKTKGGKAKIEPIVFDQVFPLYGAIDIRNSSIERNHAIQQDLLEQLKYAGEVVQKAKEKTNMPLLQEVAYRIEKYSYNVSNILFSGDEVIIDHFLRNEVVELFEHLRVLLPELGTFIDGYFEQIDPSIRLKVTHRHEFEESITFINQELARFIDAEQDAAQKIYPHYFERFVTDGVDFNMYIGQSITPDKPFDTFYLKNLKMWQLTTLTKAARLANQLQTRMANPLKTTQLILAHSVPISISFRTAERKFDVDGAYNIRYEIIKKRIDKVHVKGSNERLTQPGKLAIVFSQSREASEYLDYIEFLQNQRMLLHDLEQLELEELQGVVGLKALRVSINMEPDESENTVNKPEIIKIVQN